MHESANKNQSEDRIVIVERSKSPKLTTRGKGLFSYEIGLNPKTAEQLIRIADNPQGGSYSQEWVNLSTIANILDNREKDKHTFSASLLVKAFIGRSANNSGLLAAALLQEQCLIRPLPDQPTLLTSASFDRIRTKIKERFDEGIDLVDHVAKAKEQREAKKEQRKAERALAKIHKEAPVKDDSEPASKSKSQTIEKDNKQGESMKSPAKKPGKAKTKADPKKKKVTKSSDAKSGQ